MLLCNDLGAAIDQDGVHSNEIISRGRKDLSIKESVRIAQSNNFMGLICSSRLLSLIPALTSSIKGAGLVLVSDYSHDSIARPSPSVLELSRGIDGLLSGNAVLKFRDSIDQ